MMAKWRKSSLSQGSDHCVEVRFAEDTIFIRDSKYLRDPANNTATQPVITIPADAWHTFLDTATGHPCIERSGVPDIEYLNGGGVVLRDAEGVTLTYTTAEWHAFTAGIRIGQFAAA